MGVFDQAARYLVKRKPNRFFHWLAPRFAAAWSFWGWLDTSRISFPGDPDRICDTVAEFVRNKDRSQRCIIDVELQSESDASILERLAEYAVRIRRELNQQFPVIGALLNLTGPAQADRLDMTVAELDDAGLHLRIILRTMRDEEAAHTLRKIDTGEWDRCILPWVPLMRRAEQAAIMEEWKRLADRESDKQWQSDYAGLALVFADLANRWSIWRDALEGWNVKQSQQVLEWQAEARREGLREGELAGQRAALLRALRVRFKKKIPAKVSAAIAALNDLDELARWLDAALTADSFEVFRTAVQV